MNRTPALSRGRPPRLVATGTGSPKPTDLIESTHRSHTSPGLLTSMSVMKQAGQIHLVLYEQSVGDNSHTEGTVLADGQSVLYNFADNQDILLFWTHDEESPPSVELLRMSGPGGRKRFSFGMFRWAFWGLAFGVWFVTCACYNIYTMAFHCYLYRILNVLNSTGTECPLSS